MSKIFGIGFSRTGTKSLHKALEILGYRSVHFPESLLEIVLADAAVDTSVTVSYKGLDIFFPGSKFILTVREPKSWCESFLKQFGGAAAQVDTFRGKIRRAMFNEIPFTKEESSKLMWMHRLHLGDVQAYFRGREQDLLVMDICAGHGWPSLCRFLNKPIPDCPFPHDDTMREYPA